MRIWRNVLLAVGSVGVGVFFATYFDTGVGAQQTMNEVWEHGEVVVGSGTLQKTDYVLWWQPYGGERVSVGGTFSGDERVRSFMTAINDGKPYPLEFLDVTPTLAEHVVAILGSQGWQAVQVEYSSEFVSASDRVAAYVDVDKRWYLKRRLR